MSKISYKKLFKKMIDLDMKNSELMEKAKVSRSTFYKMKNSENITTDVIIRICDSLNCDINEIMELVDDKNNWLCNRIDKSKGVKNEIWKIY